METADAGYQVVLIAITVTYRRSPRTAPRTPNASSMPARPYPGSVRSDADLRAGDGLARGRGVSGRPGGTWTYAAAVYVIEFVSACT